VFETEIRPQPSLLSFVAQQTGVALAGILWGFVFEWIPESLSALPRPRGAVLEACSILVIWLLPAFALGAAMQRDRPETAANGRWIWCLPACLGVLACMKGRNFFEGALYPPHDGEAWWGVLLLTNPSLACIGYSMGINFVRWRAAKRSRLGG